MLPDAVHPWFAVMVTAVIFVVLQLRRGTPTDLLFLCGLLAVTLGGVISVDQALSGFANPAVMAIAALLIVAAGLRSTGVIDSLGRTILGRAESEQQVLRRMTPLMLFKRLVATIFTTSIRSIVTVPPVSSQFSQLPDQT